MLCIGPALLFNGLKINAINSLGFWSHYRWDFVSAIVCSEKFERIPPYWFSYWRLFLDRLEWAYIQVLRQPCDNKLKKRIYKPFQMMLMLLSLVFKYLYRSGYSYFSDVISLDKWIWKINGNYRSTLNGQGRSKASAVVKGEFPTPLPRAVEQTLHVDKPVNLTLSWLPILHVGGILSLHTIWHIPLNGNSCFGKFYHFKPECPFPAGSAGPKQWADKLKYWKGYIRPTEDPAELGIRKRIRPDFPEYNINNHFF